jgi:hypothetical protein
MVQVKHGINTENDFVLHHDFDKFLCVPADILDLSLFNSLGHDMTQTTKTVQQGVPPHA